MTNKEIINQLRLTSSLLEFHQFDPKKIKAFASAVFKADLATEGFGTLEEQELCNQGFTKSIAAAIYQLARFGSFPELDNLLEMTPSGILELLDLKGIGAKKVRLLWDELGIETPKSLLEACREGKVAQVKGFGEKTQEQLKQQILFLNANAHQQHYAEVEPYAIALEEELANHFRHASLAGDLRMQRGVVTRIRLVVSSDSYIDAHRILDQIAGLKEEPAKSSPYCWRGIQEDLNIRMAVHIEKPAIFYNKLFLLSAKPKHLYADLDGNNLQTAATAKPHPSEESIYQALGLPYIVPALREGTFEIPLAKAGKLPKLVQMEDIKGILHNHSTYSDGRHSLREMAESCRDLGYEYLGITDHSVSAFYANGLNLARIKAQHQEIDQLNQELAPFVIFKGIESDILGDGRLDYEDEVLDMFDFVISSIHSNLNMTKENATARLIKAIRNPYTTTLGHPTGRLLLKRKGYPIDHLAIIKACAEEDVSIEVNANPWRLDLDWRWVHEAISRGVKISINPDAHDKEHYRYMRFGLLVAQKGGLTKEMTVNSLGRDQIMQLFQARKARARKLINQTA